MARVSTTPGGTPIPSTCVVGGAAPGGNIRPCETIAIGLIDAWKIDEGTGTVAAGVLGRASITLTPYTLNPEDAWNASGDDDQGRKFFGGYGFTTLPLNLSASGVPGSGQGLLTKVGDSITIAQRRWVTGLQHIRTPLPFSALSFGTLTYQLLALIADSGPSLPAIYCSPRLSNDDVGGIAAVVGRNLYRGLPPYHIAIPGTEAGLPGFPAIYPSLDEPAPALWVVTATMIAPDVVSFSFFGGMLAPDGGGLVTLAPVCYNSNADGSVGDVDVPGTGDVAPASDIATQFVGGNIDGETIANAAGVGDQGGTQEAPTLIAGSVIGEDTIFSAAFGGGQLRTLGIGGVASNDTIHQAAIWARALTQSEIAWLMVGEADGAKAASLDRLFATLAAPGSQCGSASSCSESGGLGTANPFLDATGIAKLTPTTITRVDTHAIVIDDSVELRATRRAAEAVPVVYELAWEASQVNEDQLKRVREALAITAHGATWTRWRHPADDIRNDGTVCSAPRYRIRNADELALQRGRGGHVGSMRLVLERMD